MTDLHYPTSRETQDGWHAQRYGGRRQEEGWTLISGSYFESFWDVKILASKWWIKTSKYLKKKRAYRSVGVEPLESDDWWTVASMASISNPLLMMHHWPPRTIRDTSMLHFSTLVFQKSLGRDHPHEKEWLWCKIRKGDFKTLRDRNVVAEIDV